MGKGRKMQWVGIVFLMSAVLVFYGDLTKPEFRDGGDLSFVSGPLDGITVVNSGKTHSFEFRLQNYRNTFAINNDYVPLLQSSQFASLDKLTILKIGFLGHEKNYLNSADKPVYVYSITAGHDTYLDWEQSQKRYNSFFLKGFSLSLLFCSILSFLYSRKMPKPELLHQ